MIKNVQLMKRFAMICFVTALIGSLFSLPGKALSLRQKEPSNSRLTESCVNAPGGTSSWTLDTTVNNVECYYRIETCNGATTVFLRFHNKNAGNVKISWEEIFTTQYEKAVPGFFGSKELVLQPGYTPEYNCNLTHNVLVIKYDRVNPAYPAEVSEFKFSNLSVTSL